MHNKRLVNGKPTIAWERLVWWESYRTYVRLTPRRIIGHWAKGVDALRLGS